MPPIFSIITCTKNNARYVRENIDSVRAQTFRDYEHIFVDGFSSDGTKEIIQEYEKNNPERVKVFSSSPAGIAEAMNRGVRHARGRYLLTLHSDDCMHDETVLADAAAFLRQSGEPDWIYAREVKIDSVGNLMRERSEPALLKHGSSSMLSRYLLGYYNFIRHQSVFIKKSVFERHGYFDETFPFAMDYEFWLRIKNHTRWIYFDRIVDFFRVHDSGNSSNPLARDRAQVDEMRAGRLYLNGFEFYVLRPVFKVAAKSLSLISEQFRLYRMLK